MLALYLYLAFGLEDVTGVLYLGHLLAALNYILQGGFFIIYARIDNTANDIVIWT